MQCNIVAPTHEIHLWYLFQLYVKFFAKILSFFPKQGDWKRYQTMKNTQWIGIYLTFEISNNMLHYTFFAVFIPSQVLRRTIVFLSFASIDCFVIWNDYFRKHFPSEFKRFEKKSPFAKEK